MWKGMKTVSEDNSLCNPHFPLAFFCSPTPTAALGFGSLQTLLFTQVRAKSSPKNPTDHPDEKVHRGKLFHLWGSLGSRVKFSSYSLLSLTQGLYFSSCPPPSSLTLRLIQSHKCVFLSGTAIPPCSVSHISILMLISAFTQLTPHSFCCWCWIEFVCVCVEVACLCCCFVPYRDISVQTDDEVSTVYFVVKQLLCPVAKLQSMLLKKLKDTKRQARLLTIKEFWGFVGRNILYICLYTSAICYNSLPGTSNKITLPKLYQIPKHNGAFRKELTWKHQLISDR